MRSQRSSGRAALLALLAVLGLVLSTSPATAQELPPAPDRYGTAARAAVDAFPDGAAVAVLASGEGFADALAAAPLAASYDAPVLLTGRTSLPEVTRAALVELDVADVVVMGGTAAVGVEVTNALNADYQVSRVAGADRYGTAARAAVDAFPGGAAVAVLASGEGFADALAAAPLAASYDAPVLLTGRTSLPEVTRAALVELDVADVVVMGGTAAVGVEVTNALNADYQVSRVAGAAGSAPSTTTAQVFFPRTPLAGPCGEVFPVTRTVPADAPLAPTLESLLAGPTSAERAQGYGGWFSEQTAGLLRGVRVESGTAFVDLADLRAVIPNASTSCGSATLLAQLDRTVTQFPTVERARYSIAGDQAAFYTWLQLAPPS